MPHHIMLAALLLIPSDLPRASAGRGTTTITVAGDNESATVNIKCPFGIDRATLKRGGNNWPKQTAIRLHLKGLESFEVASGNVTLAASVPATSESQPQVSLRQDGQESAVDKNSPYWSEVKFIAEAGTETGYFEIPLPSKLFEGNPESIQLRWIDFYRN